MAKYYVQGEGLSIGSSFDAQQFGDLDLVENIMRIRESKKVQVWGIKTGGSITNAPAFDDGVVYIGCCDHIFYALSAKLGTELWRFKTKDVVSSGTAVSGDIVLFGSYDGNLYALNKRDGSIVWKFTTSGAIFSKPTVADGMAFFGSKDRNVYAVSFKDGSIVWKFATGDRVSTDIAVSEGVAYCGSEDGNLYALDSRTGRLLWKFTVGEAVETPLVHKGAVYFGALDYCMYAIDLTGKPLWKFKTQNWIGVRPLSARDGILYFSSTDSHIYAVDTKSGRLVWKFKTDDTTFSHVTLADKAYFGSTDSNVYAVDYNGKLAWKFKTGAAVTTVGPMADGVLYFGSMDCNIYAVKADGKLLWKFPTSMSEISRVEVEPRKGEAKSFEVTWAPITAEEKEKKYKKDEVDIADYGTFSGNYIDVGKSDYMGHKKKGYLK
jgi:outer membrane protein assembly factor BamB